MAAPTLPDTLVDARHTPVFDLETMPAPLARVHRSNLWATLHVEDGSVRYTDLEGADPRDVRVDAGDSVVIAPGVAHHVEPSTDGRFFVQFHREPGEALVPGQAEDVDHVRRSGAWEHRGRDVDSPEEVAELVTRQYVDLCQDDLLAPYFDFGPRFVDWDAHVRAAGDFWNQALQPGPDRDVDAMLERIRRQHERRPFTPAVFDRWLDIFDTTVDGGWAGPNAEQLKKRARGLAWAAAARTLGRGAWSPAG